MRVIVTGLVATYPVGGVAWDYLQYVQGFRTLGCEVTYLEDTGQWLYDPAAQTFTDDVRANARHLNDALASLEPALARRWSLRAPDGTYHGLDEPAVARACAAADLFLNLSGACWLRDGYRAARTGQLASTIGWRVGCQVRPPAGIGHRRRPISSPRVKKTSCWRIRLTENWTESSATPASTAAIFAWL